MKKAVKVPSKPKSKRVMVLFGLDEQQKPRAAVFGEANFKLARKAAGLMALQVHVGDAGDLAVTVNGIKPGRIYGTGTGFVPNIRPKRYEKLLAALKVEASQPPPKLAETKLPTSWDAIEVGHQVIAQADDPSLGWWETVVEGIEGDMLALRARDFPDVTVTRHCYAVALAYTKEFAPPDMTEAAPSLPKDWSALKDGDLVLAHESQEDGWWEALVMEREGRGVVLRWRDYPKQPRFTRAVSGVALLYPKAP